MSRQLTSANNLKLILCQIRQISNVYFLQYIEYRNANDNLIFLVNNVSSFPTKKKLSLHILITTAVHSSNFAARRGKVNAGERSCQNGI